MASIVGMKINKLRRERRLTLDQLAQATDSSKSYMWELENKEIARPSAEKLNRIAAALGVTSEFLADPAQTNLAENDADIVFYRKYQQAEPNVKDKLKRILDVLDDDG